MASYYLFVARDGTASSANHLREVKDGEQLVVIKGDRATYTNNGTEYTLQIPDNGSQDDILSAIEAHKSRHVRMHVEDVTDMLDGEDIPVAVDLEAMPMPTVEATPIVQAAPDAEQLMMRMRQEYDMWRGDMVRSSKQVQDQQQDQNRQLTARVLSLERDVASLKQALTAINMKLEGVDNIKRAVNILISTLTPLTQNSS